MCSNVKYRPEIDGFRAVTPRMDKGTIFLLHDYSSISWAGAKKAIDDLCHKQYERIILMPDKSGSAFFLKSH